MKRLIATISVVLCLSSVSEARADSLDRVGGAVKHSAERPTADKIIRRALEIGVDLTPIVIQSYRYGQACRRRNGRAQMDEFFEDMGADQSWKAKPGAGDCCYQFAIMSFSRISVPFLEDMPNFGHKELPAHLISTDPEMQKRLHDLADKIGEEAKGSTVEDAISLVDSGWRNFDQRCHILLDKS